MTARPSRALILLALAAACGSTDEDGLFGGDGGASAASGSGGSGATAADASAGASSGGVAGSGGSAGSGGVAGAAGAAGAAGVGAVAGEAGAAGAAGEAGKGGSGGAGTPGTIQCGAAPCATDFNVCCTCPACPLPYPTQCFPKLTGCVGTGKLMTCDDAADCASGVCCAHFQQPNLEFTGATCEPSCPAQGNAQLCTVDGECPAEHACKALASLPGFKGCQPK